MASKEQNIFKMNNSDMAIIMIKKLEDESITKERRIGMIKWLMDYLDRKLADMDDICN